MHKRIPRRKSKQVNKTSAEIYDWREFPKRKRSETDYHVRTPKT